jgi:hypothetical protein
MYPHERSLVKKMEGKPFALIGVNSDADRDALKEESNRWLEGVEAIGQPSTRLHPIPAT